MFEDLLTLRQHRNLKMMSIKELAKKSETGTQTIVKIEGGKRVRPSTFGDLAKALEVKPEEIREFMLIATAE